MKRAGFLSFVVFVLMLGLAQAQVPAGTLPQFAQLAKDLSPAVVNISVEGEEPEDTQEAPPQAPGVPGQRSPGEPFRSLGSGFILSEDGYIATNNHVVEKSENVIVRLLDDPNDYRADVIARDLKTDLALIKIKPHNALKVVVFGDSDKVEVGEWVLAIGNQFQLGQTVTAGIVSAKSRRVATRGSGPYDAFIQTDASINPGSSGGPLFNTKGEVIGINTAIFSPGRAQFGGTGFNIGIGFAIPSNLVKAILLQLREKGKVTRGYLGVIIQRVDSDVAAALNLDSPQGALVSDILEGSPAAKAGFQRKDVIVSYEGQPVKQHEDLPLMVASTAIGSNVTIGVLRSGRSAVLNVKIEELKDKEAVPKEVLDKPVVNRLGLVVQTLTDDIRRSLNLPLTSAAPIGVIVSGVQPGSVAERGGMARGDVIEELAGKQITGVDDFEAVVQSLTTGKPVLVLVRKPEGTRYLTLKVK